MLRYIVQMTSSTIPILPETEAILAARSKWRYTGTERPAFAHTPGEGQVSVWDFPRPPLLQPCLVPISVFYKDREIATTANAVRVAETAGAPSYYFPPDDVDMSQLAFGEMTSVCEWKGVAQTITVAGQANAAWRYVRMFEAYAELHEWIAFYPGKLTCLFGDQPVAPQPGGFYGGWVTANLAGPIKGEPGSENW